MNSNTGLPLQHRICFCPLILLAGNPIWYSGCDRRIKRTGHTCPSLFLVPRGTFLTASTRAWSGGRDQVRDQDQVRDAAAAASPQKPQPGAARASSRNKSCTVLKKGNSSRWSKRCPKVAGGALGSLRLQASGAPAERGKFLVGKSSRSRRKIGPQETAYT